MELPGKVEKAFQKVMVDLLVGTAYETLWVGRGFEADEKPIPRVSFYCADFNEEPQQTGNGFCTVVMQIQSGSDRQNIDPVTPEQPVQDHNTLVAAVSVIWRDNLATLLSNAVSDFFVEEDIEALPSQRHVDGRRFITESRWRIYAYNCDIDHTA